MNMSKEGTIIGFNQPNNFINDKKELPQQTGNALSGMKKDTQNPQPNIEPTEKDQEVRSNMYYLFEKIRDMQTKTKIITIFTIVSIVILTLTIVILAGRSRTRVVSFTFQGKQTVPNTNTSIEHYNGVITKDNKDINFGAQVVRKNTAEARLLQQDIQITPLTPEQDGVIVTLTFSSYEGGIVTKATSPQDFEIQYSPSTIVGQLSRGSRGYIKWDIKVNRLLQQLSENSNEWDTQTQIILKSIAAALDISSEQLVMEQYDALKVTFHSDGTYTPQLEASQRLLQEAGDGTKVPDDLQVEIGIMLSNLIVAELQQVQQVLKAILPNDFDNIDKNDSLGMLLKDSNFNPSIDANVVQSADKPAKQQKSPAKQQKKQESKSSEKPADSSSPKKEEDKKPQKKPEQKKRRTRRLRNLKPRWISRHKDRKTKKTVNASEQSFNKSKGCTDVNDGKQKLCDVKVLNEQKSVIKLQGKSSPAVGKARIFRRRRILNRKKRLADKEQKKNKPNTDKPSNEQSNGKPDQKLTTQEIKTENGGN